MKYQGYTIEAAKHETIRSLTDAERESGWTDVPPTVVKKDYTVAVEDKVIAIGCETVEIAKKIVDQRISLRQRRGLDPVG